MIEYDDNAVENKKIQEKVEAAVKAAGFLPYNGYGNRPFEAGIHNIFWIYPAIPPYEDEVPGKFLWIFPNTRREQVNPKSFAEIQIRIPTATHPDDDLIVFEQNKNDDHPAIVWGRDDEQKKIAWGEDQHRPTKQIWDVEVVLFKEHMKEALDDLLREIEKILRPEDPNSIQIHVRTVPLR